MLEIASINILIWRRLQVRIFDDLSACVEEEK
jgi:hypothetical protein